MNMVSCIKVSYIYYYFRGKVCDLESILQVSVESPSARTSRFKISSHKNSNADSSADS